MVTVPGVVGVGHRDDDGVGCVGSVVRPSVGVSSVGEVHRHLVDLLGLVVQPHPGGHSDLPSAVDGEGGGVTGVGVGVLELMGQGVSVGVGAGDGAPHRGVFLIVLRHARRCGSAGVECRGGVGDADGYFPDGALAGAVAIVVLCRDLQVPAGLGGGEGGGGCPGDVLPGAALQGVSLFPLPGGVGYGTVRVDQGGGEGDVDRGGAGEHRDGSRFLGVVDGYGDRDGGVGGAVGHLHLEGVLRLCLVVQVHLCSELSGARVYAEPGGVGSGQAVGEDVPFVRVGGCDRFPYGGVGRGVLVYLPLDGCAGERRGLVGALSHRAAGGG